MKHLYLPVLALIMAACSPSAPAPDLHERVLTLDTHIDIPLNYMSEIDPSGETELQVDLPKLAAGQLDSGFWIIYTPQSELTEAGYAEGLDIATTRYQALQRLTSEITDDFVLARNSSQVRDIVGQGKHVVLLGMENAYPLGESVADVPLWAERGVRYMGLTHFGHNQFGDSSNPNPARDDGPRHNGLSDLGKSLIRAMNANGIMVDVSHAGKATMMQAAELSSTPIIASHSGVKAVAESARNLDDEQLRKIKEVGGVAQMVALGSYVKAQTPVQIEMTDAMSVEFGVKTRADYAVLDDATKAKVDARRAEIAAMEPLATVADFVDHIDHAVSVAGIDHVGIASDFDGGGGIIGWQDASETPNVTAELLKRGYSEDEIAKIWSENLLRVLDVVQAKAR